MEQEGFKKSFLINLSKDEYPNIMDLYGFFISYNLIINLISKIIKKMFLQQKFF